MKTILFVYHVSAIGGGSFCLLNILKEFPRDKYRPMVLLAKPGPLVREIEKLGIEVIFMPDLTVWPYNHSLCKLSSLKCVRKVFAAVKSFEKLLSEHTEIDAVYLNTFMLAPYLKAAKKQGKKTAIHIREHWPKNEHKKQLSWMQQQIADYADEVIAISSYSASLASNPSKTIVYDWIDFSERYKPMPFNEIFGEDCSDKKVFLYSGGMQRIKGAKEIITTFINDMTNQDYRLLVLGFDSNLNLNGWKRKLKYILHKIGLRSFEFEMKLLVAQDKRIKCIPAVYEMKHIMEQAYCNLSYFTIPHANLALAENIILGTPSVASETEESLEYSDNGKLSVLYKLGDTEAFGKAVKYMLDNYDAIKQSILDNRYKIEKMFSREENSKRLATVYDRLFE